MHLSHTATHTESKSRRKQGSWGASAFVFQWTALGVWQLTITNNNICFARLHIDDDLDDDRPSTALVIQPFL